jgi:hypothetical protein
MKSDGKRRPAASIVDDGAFEGLKKRARDVGLIVNAGQTGTVRKPGPKVRKVTGGRKKGDRK